jgi:SAM-dependent methyltransferase
LKDKVVGTVYATLHSRLVSAIVYHRYMRQAVGRLPALNRIYLDRISQHGWGVPHPFDRAHGTKTIGLVYEPAVHEDFNESGKGRYIYAGSQPSIVRAALRTLPALDSYTFVDFGCGKGRALIVASEFPFKEIIGVEYSPTLAEIARANAAVVRRRLPKRLPIRIETGDAAAYPLPAGNFVVFLYNPFGEDLIGQVVKSIESAIRAQSRSVFVIYLNPVYGRCLDASQSLTRYFAAQIPYAPEELGFGPDESDCVVIWQSASEARAPLPGADDAFETIVAGKRVIMVSTPAR